MQAPNHHIIQRQVIELEFPAGVDGFALQQEIGRIVREKILPRVEVLFDRFAGADDLIRIDKLELDIGHIPPAELEDALIRTVLKQLEEQLEIAVFNRPPGVDRRPVAESRLEQWLFFLENGYRPQVAANVPESILQTAVLEQLAAETAAVERFRGLLQKHPAAVIRLIRQHPDSFLIHVLETLTARSQRGLPDFFREIKQWRDAFRIATKRAGTLEKPVSGSLEQTLSPLSFLQSAFGAVVDQPASDWTTDNLFTAFLQHVAASAGTQQKQLLHFWQDVVQVGRTDYPLLKATLERHPELLNAAAGNRAGHEKSLPEEWPETGSERSEIPKAGHGAEKPAGADPASSLPADALPAETGRADMPSQDEDRTQRRSPEENPGRNPQSVPPEDESAPPIPDVQANEPTLPQTAQDPVSNDPGKALPQADPRQQHSELEAEKVNTPGDIRPEPVQPATEFNRTVRTGDFWYVANAGVVLLHPFLSPFFKTTGLVEQGKFIDETARHKAVHLVHFLATAQTHAPEYDLVLPRFLCGLPFDVPLERFVDITAAEQAECEKLLTAAIDHWNKLGNTSPGGLREGFLQRDGKLEKRESGWYLGVEQKTIDILLDFLPWNLSIIKLPWMPELLRVEWA